MVMKFAHFGKYIRSTWTVLKCGVGKGWRGSEMRRDEVLRRVKEEGNILHAIKKKEG
jgi:hypothetical protein